METKLSIIIVSKAMLLNYVYGGKGFICILQVEYWSSTKSCNCQSFISTNVVSLPRSHWSLFDLRRSWFFRSPFVYYPCPNKMNLFQTTPSCSPSWSRGRPRTSRFSWTACPARRARPSSRLRACSNWNKRGNWPGTSWQKWSSEITTF